VARIELLDEVQVDAVNRYSKLSYAVKPTLLFEFHATSASGAAEHATAVQEIAAEHGGTEFRWATTTEDRARLWAARHNTYYAAMAMRPGGKSWVTDVCVPISALAECIAETKTDLAASRAYAPLVGHVGDGNFHLNFMLDPDDAEEVAEVKRLNARLVARALRLGGTCTGEHGVGLGKQKYLLDEHGQDAVDVMRALKQALDPAGLMNPGKIF
jgi:D-lactate dehydrogenase (cytochrome)